MKILITLIAVMPLLTGCIVSSEYEELWESGTVDTNMIGLWEGHIPRQDFIARIGITSNIYKIHVTNIHAPLGDTPESQYSYSFLGRDVQVGTNLFMLCPSLQVAMLEAMMGTNLPALAAQRDEASLLHYVPNEDGFTLYFLESMTIQRAIDQKLIEGEISPPPDPTYRHVDVPRVTQFDSVTLATLAEIFAKEKSWHTPTTFTKMESEPAVPPYAPQAARE